MDNRVVGMLIRAMVDGVKIMQRSHRPAGGGYWKKNRKYRRAAEGQGRIRLSQFSALDKRMRYASRRGLTDVTRTGMRALPIEQLR
jgi:hypothetical protein